MPVSAGATPDQGRTGFSARACTAAAFGDSAAMRFPRQRVAMASLLACAACSTAGAIPADLARLLAEAPPAATARLWLDGDRIVGAAVPTGPGDLPAGVRTMVDAVVPRGELEFQGREWSARGEGYRIDKRYSAEDRRSVLISPAGTVLERDHTVAIADVPQHVLASALRIGSHIDEVRIVSGPEHEENWSLVLHDRSGRVFVAEITFDGRVLRSRRRVDARVDG